MDCSAWLRSHPSWCRAFNNNVLVVETRSWSTVGREDWPLLLPIVSLPFNNLDRVHEELERVRGPHQAQRITTVLPKENIFICLPLYVPATKKDSLENEG